MPGAYGYRENYYALLVSILTNGSPEVAFLKMEGIFPVSGRHREDITPEDIRDMAILRVRDKLKLTELAEIYAMTDSEVCRRVKGYQRKLVQSEAEEPLIKKACM